MNPNSKPLLTRSPQLYTPNPNPNSNPKSDVFTYTIDWQTYEQVNIKTDSRRHIRRTGEDWHQVEFDPNPDHLSNKPKYNKKGHLVGGIKVNKEHKYPALVAAFQEFDKDGSGTIDAEEVQKVMVSLGRDMTTDEVSKWIEEADANGDGIIDYTEFAEYMMNKDRKYPEIVRAFREFDKVCGRSRVVVSGEGGVKVG